MATHIYTLIQTQCIGKLRCATYAVSSSTSAISSIMRTTTSSVTKPNNSVRNTSGMARLRGAAGGPFFQRTLCYIHLLLFHIYTSKIRLAISPIVLIAGAGPSQASCSALPSPDADFLFPMPPPLFPGYSPVKLWKRAPTQPAMGAARWRPHAVLKAQRPTTPSLRQLLSSHSPGVVTAV